MLAFILIIFSMILWQEYSFQKNMDLKIFVACMDSVPSAILQDYELLKNNIEHCKNLLK